MEEKSKHGTDEIWDRTMELFINIHDFPENPEHFNSLVHWLNEHPAHLQAFNELGQIWMATGVALAREVGHPLTELEGGLLPLMAH